MKTYKILDADVFLQDFEYGKGKTIISDNYGHNYSYYWNAMGEDISSFILDISEDYFINKLVMVYKSTPDFTNII